MTIRLSRVSGIVTASTLTVAGLFVGPFVTAAHAAVTFTVNTAGNAADTFVDGNCDTSAAAGLQCTLRGAIQEANGAAGLDTIKFALPSPYKVTLTAAGLPAITSPVLIDGTTQTGFSPATGVIVRVDGVTSTTGVQYGFDIQPGGAGSTVKGLEIDRFAGAGVRLQSDNNVVAGNYLGSTAANLVNCSAGSSCGNGTGVNIADGSNNLVGGTTAAARNVISNNYNGIFVQADPSSPATANNTISGNYIGTNVAGTAALANTYGIYDYNLGSGADPTNTTIGGTALGAGNVISGNTNEGVDVQYGSWTVAGNIVGLNAAGTAAVPNSGIAGVYAEGASTAITVGGASTASRNVISGNSQQGVELASVSPGSVVRNNYLGLNATGTAQIANVYSGAYAFNSDDVTIDGNVIAGGYDDLRVDSGSNAVISNNSVGLAIDGTTALSGAGSGITIYNTIDTTVTSSVVAAQASYGVYVQSTDGLVVTNNRIGTDVSGTLDRGNGEGIYLSTSSEATIGKPGNGNLISGNDSYGIQAYADDDSTIAANLIGTEITGATALANGATGIYLNSSSRMIVGGTSAAQRNVVVASGFGCCEAGIYLGSSDTNSILGNRVGVSATGNAVPNNWVGVYLDSSSDANQIGGVSAGSGNLIANNADAGVVPNGVGNSVRGNSIHDNGQLGIDLNQDGVTLNDAGDRDGGGNRLQNFPVLTTSASNGNGTQISGTLSSRASRSYTLDFYANSSCDPSGNGEGDSYLGSATVTTSGAGNVSFQASVAGIAAAGSQVVATATDASLGDTSEFSACLANQGGLPSASVANVSASEGTGNLTFTVSLSAAPVFTPVTVDYVTADGTAILGVDYSGQAGTVTFAPGETLKTVSITVVNDTLDENDETFTLTLSNPTNAILAPGAGTATGTIQDNDAPPLVSFTTAPAVTEGDAGSVNQTFTVTLSAVSSLPVSVVADTVSGSAVEGVDFTPNAAQLNFAPGETSKTFIVAVLGDLLDEANETYSAQLLTPTNATIGTGTKAASITDNDNPPAASVGDFSAVEGNSGKTVFTFPVSLSAPSGRTVRVYLSTADGSATQPSDYLKKTSVAVLFNPGDTAANFLVSVKGNTVVEPTETFTVNIVSTQNATVADGSGTGTIVNDD